MQCRTYHPRRPHFGGTTQVHARHYERTAVLARSARDTADLRATNRPGTVVLRSSARWFAAANKTNPQEKRGVAYSEPLLSTTSLTRSKFKAWRRPHNSLLALANLMHNSRLRTATRRLSRTTLTSSDSLFGSCSTNSRPGRTKTFLN